MLLQIVFEGEVGANNLGDIAIDDISIIQGACPSKSPDPWLVTWCQDTMTTCFYTYEKKTE